MAAAAAPAGDVVAGLVDQVKADIKGRLLDLLDETAGRKALFLDSSISGPLDLILSGSDLREHGVQSWYKLSENPQKIDCSQVLFLVRCTRPELVDWIAAQILSDEAREKDRLYVVVFLPRKTEQCSERLARGNVRANVRVVECALHFFPFDTDVLSMESLGLFHDFHVLGDPSGVFYAAKALMHLQAIFGVIPALQAIGSAGKAVLDVMLRLREEEKMREAVQDPRLSVREPSQPGVPPVARLQQHQAEGASGGAPAASSSSRGPPRISEVVLIDRRVDPFSILCSQFTYQALIDQIFGIVNNSTDVSARDWGKDRKQGPKLSSEEPLFKEIRDLHIDKLGPLLQEKAHDIQQVYAEKDKFQSTKEMADWFPKFKLAQSTHQLVELHINMAHDLRAHIQGEDYSTQLHLEDEITAQSSKTSLETVEDYIDDRRPVHEVLRLLCLYSVVNNGMKQKQLDQIKHSFIQAYGYEHLLTLCNLERVGMLRYHQGKSVWSSIKQQFNLIVEEPQAARDISYAYSGYAPLSVRLVQKTRSTPKGWRACQEALNLLDGPAQCKEQQQPGSLAERGAPSRGGEPDARDRDGSASNAPHVTLVCFLGGVTHGEIAALRRLSELEDGQRRFLIVTTEFTNTRKFFDGLRCEHCFNQGSLETAKKKKEQEQKGKSIVSSMLSGFSGSSR